METFLISGWFQDIRSTGWSVDAISRSESYVGVSVGVSVGVGVNFLAEIFGASSALERNFGFKPIPETRIALLPVSGCQQHCCSVLSAVRQCRVED